jgi:hypothetical protein
VAEGVRYVDDVPEHVEARLRELCLALPETSEQQAWKGTRWVVRKKNFASVLGVLADGVPDDAEPLVVLAFRAVGEELEILRRSGHPFFVLGWGRDAMGMVLDASTDWDEVRELVTESYCALAPKKLVALVERPSTDEI